MYENLVDRFCRPSYKNEIDNLVHYYYTSSVSSYFAATELRSLLCLLLLLSYYLLNLPSLYSFSSLYLFLRVSGSEDLGRDDDEEGNGGETEGVPGGL